jgi:serine/threonine-protein kinase
VTTVDAQKSEHIHAYPQILPDGANVLFTLVTSTGGSIAIAPLAGGGAPRILVQNATRGRYVRTGHLLYLEDTRGHLSAAAFDLDRAEVTGRPIDLGITTMATTGDAISFYDVSDEGTLVYSLAGQLGDEYTVERIGRGGRSTTLVAELGSWTQPAVSPDGQSVLLRRAAQPDCTFWRLDLARGSLSRLGIEGDAHSPLWMPDGEHILASVQPRGSRGTRRVFELRADGGGSPIPLTNVDPSVYARSLSPDGRYIALVRDVEDGRNDILIHDRSTGETRPFLDSPYDESSPAFSPDGRMIAYAANDTGRSEIYVRPFPEAGAKYTISNQGGMGPVWSRDGRELFYAEGSKMMAVSVSRSPRFAASVPAALFENAAFVWERARNYDVLADGSGFVIVRRGANSSATPSVRVVFGFFGELGRSAGRANAL